MAGVESWLCHLTSFETLESVFLSVAAGVPPMKLGPRPPHRMTVGPNEITIYKRPAHCLAHSRHLENINALAPLSSCAGAGRGCHAHLPQGSSVVLGPCPEPVVWFRLRNAASRPRLSFHGWLVKAQRVKSPNRGLSVLWQSQASPLKAHVTYCWLWWDATHLSIYLKQQCLEQSPSLSLPHPLSKAKWKDSLSHGEEKNC